MRAWIAAVVVLLAGLSATACGSEEPPNLLAEYLDSDEVANDPYSGMGSGADRRAAFAAYGPPEEVLGGLLSAYRCPGSGVNSCELDGANTRVGRAIGDTGAEVFARRVLVKHHDGTLEFMSLFVAVRAGDDPLLFDVTGESYDGGLDDFRANNDVLISSDWILAPTDVLVLEGEFEVETVSGRTSPTWLGWLLWGGIAVVAVAVGVGVYRAVWYRRHG